MDKKTENHSGESGLPSVYTRSTELHSSIPEGGSSIDNISENQNEFMQSYGLQPFDSNGFIDLQDVVVNHLGTIFVSSEGGKI